MAVKVVNWLLILLVLICCLILSGSATISSSGRKMKDLIPEINRNGPYLGLITVYSPEEDAFFAAGAFQPNQKHPFVDLSGRRFRIGRIGGTKVIYVRCGVGMVNAATATQQLLDVFDMIGIVHFGIAGNANSSMSIGDVVVLKQISQTGLWDWLKPNAVTPGNDVAELNFGSFNMPFGGGNELGSIAYKPEYFYSESGEPDNGQYTLWFRTSQDWLELASNLEGMQLEMCINSSFCLPEMPKVVVGLNGTSSNSFVDNAAYRGFLYRTFHVTSIDMESAAIVMTTLSNGSNIIVIRGLSDLAGAQRGDNPIKLFGPLAASNVATAVVNFVKTLGRQHKHLQHASSR